ncbi:hypothetical protein [Bradyrhizobium cenepequi]
MAWQVFDFMEPQGYDRKGAMHGPLPCKRWVKSPSDKRHKLNYRFRFSRAGTGEKADDMNARHAIEYARWLALRDGMEIPADTAPRVDWSGITDAAGKWRKRIRAVEFGSSRTIRQGYGRNAYTSYHWDIAVRIEIPNWDFVPAEPVEEIIPDPAEIPAAPAFRIPPRFLLTSCLAPVNDRVPLAPSLAIRAA